MVSTNGYGLFWNTAAHSWFDNRFPSEIRFSSNASHAIDYYFLYGPEFDQIIHQYREMTGHAPMYGEWAYGFWQSKDRYKSDDDLLRIAKEYRDAKVPIDNIVQDWFWWVHQGDPEFRPEAYPDVPGTLEKLHDQHFHTMLSVWAMFDPKSQNFQQMKALGLTIPDTTDYDATNPAAGDFYWTHLLGKFYAQGWDGFWLDSSEPEKAYAHGGESDAQLYDKKLFIGNGALYTNIFPLMHTGNIYTHWREETDKKRIFILTRSGFAGDQRYAATHGRATSSALSSLSGRFPPDSILLSPACLTGPPTSLATARRMPATRTTLPTRSSTHAGSVRSLLPHLPHARPPRQ